MTVGQPRQITQIEHGSGCAQCAGKQAYVCNSLESLFPSIAAEFGVDKNDFTAGELTAHSHKESLVD